VVLDLNDCRSDDLEAGMGTDLIGRLWGRALFDAMLARGTSRHTSQARGATQWRVRQRFPVAARHTGAGAGRPMR
jgi:hypothetical protein